VQDVSRVFREFMDLERRRTSSGFSPEELRRWQLLKRRLAQEFHPGLSDEHADRRSSLRVPTLLRVRFPDRRSLARCLLTNISRGGVFVTTPAPEPMGTPIRIAIQIEGDAEDLVASCEVVAVHFGAGHSQEAQGMALAFRSLDARTQARLDALYEKKLFEAAAQAQVARGPTKGLR
jgi:uncharacterized protein (TIGR02266 family)